MARIELTHITKRWGGFYAVDDLSLLIDDNAFVTLLGPSGCGKTTTLRMIAGLETPTEGKIVIDGVTVFDSDAGINIPPNKRRVGFLFQNYALWPNMTVYQNIAFGLSNIKESGLSVNDNGELIRNTSAGGEERKLTKEEIDKIVARVSAIVKIQPFMDRYPGELSGGQQQRVAIARTLAPGPKVLFMDEPLSNLDAKLRLEMRSELQRLHLSTGSTFVYVTHDQMEAMTLATRICLINNGVLQQYDEPLTVYNRPNNTFIADFVGNPAINF
ncbi:MAG: ABC transporter ATP-binding protein, partial [Synergistaceae bacterium]|nr:ABC transporter ATP-binding protein [Synergistaceae bacterium]